MDRCEFINSLSSSSGVDVEDIILDDFSTTMLLYNLIGDCDNVDINSINPFVLQCNSEMVYKIHDSINNKTLTIHDKKYIVNSVITHDKSSITININSYPSMV